MAQFPKPITQNFVFSFILYAINFCGGTLVVDSNIVLTLQCSCTLWGWQISRLVWKEECCRGRQWPGCDGGPTSRKLIWNSALQHCHLLARWCTLKSQGYSISKAILRSLGSLTQSYIMDLFFVTEEKTYYLLADNTRHISIYLFYMFVFEYKSQLYSVKTAKILTVSSHLKTIHF